tara:strand:- start:1257 stop:1664 length:408 start_codon:yes stop_codon:yes gene_type:complete
MELTRKQIIDINDKAPMDWETNEQGVFTEPTGIPNDIKTPVIYMRWISGGVSGGSCWETSNPEPFENNDPSFKVLDLVLKQLYPEISYLDFKKIEDLIKSNENIETKWEYYGNSTEYSIKFIILGDLIKYLETLV